MIIKKVPQATRGWKTFGVVFIGSSMLTLMLSPQHSMAHRFGIAALAIGSTLMSVGSSTFVPCLFLATAAFMGALFGFTEALRIPILTLSAIAVAILVYGWWKERQAQVVAKRQTHRP